MKIYLSLLTILQIIFVLSIKANTMDSTKANNLIVYGDGFTFEVKEPDGWKGDIENAAKYSSNIIFYNTAEGLDKSEVLVQMLVFEKQDENTIEDLMYDVNTYKQKYHNLKQKDFVSIHKEYKCYSKLVYVENEFYQYIVYINPGKKYKNGISITMNIDKREATKNEIQAFNKVIESLLVIK